MSNYRRRSSPISIKKIINPFDINNDILKIDEFNNINRYCEECLNDNGKLIKIKFNWYCHLIFNKFGIKIDYPDNYDYFETIFEKKYPIKYLCETHFNTK